MINPNRCKERQFPGPIADNLRQLRRERYALNATLTILALTPLVAVAALAISLVNLIQ